MYMNLANIHKIIIHMNDVYQHYGLETWCEQFSDVSNPAVSVLCPAKLHIVGIIYTSILYKYGSVIKAIFIYHYLVGFSCIDPSMCPVNIYCPNGHRSISGHMTFSKGAY